MANIRVEGAHEDSFNSSGELAFHAGRDPASIEILAFGRPGQFKNRGAINEAERAGASMVTVWLDQTEGDEALDVIEEIAKRVLP